MIGALRRVWRRARAFPLVGGVLAALDRVWWLGVVLSSGLVDPAYYAAQRGWRHGFRFSASVDYVTSGFRAGVSPNPLFDERFVGASLPDSRRVPALYAYLISDRASVPVHPWWTETGRLEEVWAGRDEAMIEVAVGGVRERMSVARWRQIALRSAARDRTDSTIPRRDAIIRLLHGDDSDSWRQVAAAVDGGDAEVAVHLVCIGCTPSDWAKVMVGVAIARRARWVDAVRVEAGTAFAEAVIAASAVPEPSSRSSVLVVDPRASLTAAGARALLQAGRSALVAPVSVGPAGTIEGIGAGVIRTQNGPRRVRPLRDHPREDAAVFAQGAVDVPLLTGRTFAVPGRLWPLFAEDLPVGAEAEALTARAREATPDLPARVLTDLIIGCFGLEPELAAPEGGRLDPRLRRRDDRTAIKDILVRAGWEPSDFEAEDAVDAHARLARLPGAPQRWAIKTSAPAGPRGDVWGDAHFAVGLARALRRLGHEVVIDAFESSNRSTTYLDDVHVVVRGPFVIAPPPTGVSIEWIISHPDEITAAEVRDFDLAYAVSPGWADRRGREWGVRIGALLECTDADQFTPRGLERTTEVVFVGTARGIARPCVVAPLAAGIDVRVYGPDWRGFIPARAIAATSIPNEELSARYETAQVVLNDHWPAMRREGFMAMRPFDVVAAGGRVISEAVPGLEEVFEGAVVVFHSEEELVALLKRDPAEIFPDDQRLAEISASIRRNHSFDARAIELDRAVTELTETVD